MRIFALIFMSVTLMVAVPHQAVAASAEPEVSALGAVLMDAKTGRVLWGKNENQALPMASTTKIMTAILALESGRCGELATVSRKAAIAPKVKMFLSEGEKVRVNNLLYALMLESSNDAAVAIAEHLDGSVEAFCAHMTQKAKEIGARDTVFETPNGLDAGDHHSTAYDMALIARYALSVPGFIELTNTPSASFSSDKRSYDFNNRNRLLHEYNGANGVKTGFTGKAGHCFVGAAKRGDMQLISVVLASGWGDRGKAMKWSDTKTLLNYGFNNYEYQTILSIGDCAGTLPVTRSRDTAVEYVYDGELTLPMNKNAKEDVQVKLNVPPSIPAPISKGDPVGEAVVMLGGHSYGVVRLTANADIVRHDLKTSIEKVMSAWLGQGIEQPVRVVLPEF